MKKKLYLQMFAEDGADTAAAGNESGTSTDGKKSGENPGTGSSSEKSQPKYTDADLDKIIGERFSRWQKEQQKAVDEAKKLAEMNATQKAEYERDQLQRQLDDYKRKDSLAEMTKTARKMLSDDGIAVPDELLSMLVTTEAEETKVAVDSFAKVFKDAVENAVKERLKGEPPKRGTGGGTATMTKEEIMKISDPELRQQKMLENRNLFKF